MRAKDWLNYKVCFRPGAVAVAVVLVAIAASLLALVPFLSVDDWPAWVQAVGSVVAIFVAIWVPARSHAREQKVARLDALAEECRVAWLCECACNDAVSAFQEIKNGAGNGAHTVRLDKISVTLRGLLDQKLPRRLVSTVFRAIAQVELALVEVLCFQGTDSVPSCKDNFDDVISALRDCQLECQAEHLELGKQAGINPPPAQRVSGAGVNATNDV